MAEAFDATTKALIEAHPADWLALAGLPLGTSIRVVDADVSPVTAAADKVIFVDGPEPYIAHFELQAGADVGLDARVLLYNVLLRWRHRVPVRSVIILLRCEAQTAGATGTVRHTGGPGSKLEFEYTVVRVWEHPPEAFLAGGLGIAPLAAAAAVRDVAQLEGVVRSLSDRFDREAGPLATDLMVSAFTLMGLRHERGVIERILKGVRTMKESVFLEIAQDKVRAIEARKMLFKFGTRRFGPPPAAVAEAIEETDDIARLEALAERAADANGWQDLLDALS